MQAIDTASAGEVSAETETLEQETPQPDQAQSLAGENTPATRTAADASSAEAPVANATQETSANTAPEPTNEKKQSADDAPLFQSPNYKLGGKIVPGHYACQEMPGMQLKSLSEMGTFQRSTTRWTSQFDILDGATYNYRGSTPRPGNYNYNLKSGTITWTSGPYSSDPGEEDTITGIFTKRASDDHPVILLVFRSPAYGESCEYCALVPKQ
ncbi:hypothetical protein ACXYMU_00420 [Pontibacter sp. CAU 1760]